MADYRYLLAAAHQQLGAPIVLAWEYMKMHKAARLRESIGTQANTTCASSDHLRLLRQGP